ncbi:hypothetical protein [Proteus terrae]|uniref:hypothetical protein n=1 Tax=Proteus terrae TaxID=1574161 RepID=UPI0034D4654D
MELKINSPYVKTSFDVVCTDCKWSGTATIDTPENLNQISVGEAINFSTPEGPAKCPSCKTGNIYGLSGTYKRNKQTNHMDRIGDYQK